MCSVPMAASASTLHKVVSIARSKADRADSSGGAARARACASTVTAPAANCPKPNCAALSPNKGPASAGPALPGARSHTTPAPKGSCVSWPSGSPSVVKNSSDSSM